MKRVLSIGLVAAAMLAGCAVSNEDMGQLSGAAVGGMVGHEFGKGGGQVLATGLGMMIGAQIGGEVGRSMDMSDRRQVTLLQALFEGYSFIMFSDNKSYGFVNIF